MPTVNLSLLELLLPLPVPFILVYLLKVRPTRARTRAAAEVQQRLRVGDRVVTHAGLHATVAALAPTTVDLESDAGCTHRYDRITVLRLLS
ncbi:preprotein translocase subunit YajC [Streptomyces pseudovenezuelae]|uniref:preprotein translocase subunit YajC n=1 Tax=Streptomyces pseudovenezuelae TaxID=67350 RepID=UPI002E2EFDDC|nr:preprotein translocase subunit YajC [Streptomyces pseudovenezuelae]